MQDQSNADGGENLLIGIGLLLVMAGGALWGLWVLFQAEIAAAVIAVQHALIRFAAIFTDRYDLLDQQLARVDPAHPSVTLGRLYNLAHNVGTFYRIPALLLLVGLAVTCFLRVGTSRFQRRLALDTLLQEHARNFRFTAAFARRGLGPVLPAPGAPRPADPTLHVREWVARFARRSDGAYDDAGARHELMQQLGPVWTGRAGAPAHVRCIFAAFALHAARRREDAVELLGDMAEGLPCNPKDGPAGPAAPLAIPGHVAARADKWLADPEVAGHCDKVAARHAFTGPALMSVLTYARERAGVMNPGMFAFLQLVDRRLYLALDCLGFPIHGVPWHRSAAQSSAVEAAGAREHWMAECEVGRPLFIPVIDTTAAAIRASAEDHPTATKV